MATCFRCGKELPEGQTGECEDGCGKPSSSQKGIPLNFLITMIPDKDKIQTEAKALAFKMAVERFGMMLGEIFVTSGINQFCKKLKGTIYLTTPKNTNESEGFQGGVL